MWNFVYDQLKKCEFDFVSASRAYCVPVDSEETTADRRSHNLFHFAVWLAGYENPPVCTVVSETTQGPVVDLYMTRKYAAFKHGSDFRTYRSWLHRYRKWFSHVDMSYRPFPPLPFTGTHRLHFTEYGCDKEGDFNSIIHGGPSDELIKAWVWIAHNATRPVYRTDVGFAFTKLTEAVAFKLSVS